MVGLKVGCLGLVGITVGWFWSSREAEVEWAMAVGRAVEDTSVGVEEFLVVKAQNVSGGRWRDDAASSVFTIAFSPETTYF